MCIRDRIYTYNRFIRGSQRGRELRGRGGGGRGGRGLSSRGLGAFRVFRARDPVPAAEEEYNCLVQGS